LLLESCTPDNPDCIAALPKDPNEDPHNPPAWPIDFYGIEGLDHVAGQPIMLTGNRQSGVYALGTTALAGNDTFVDIHDLVVRNTSRNGNEAEECGFDQASSLAAHRGADITVDRFILDASALIGVQVGAFGSIIFDEWFGTTINLSNGVVSNNPIAANIESADYDLNTLQDNVLFLNNAVNLDSEELQIPEPEGDLDDL
jgi:hypothetical protein